MVVLTSSAGGVLPRRDRLANTTYHAHRFPADVLAALAAPRPVGKMSTSALVGADITLLPLRRAETLLVAARREGRADRALIDEVAARLRELADADPLADAPLAEAGGMAAAPPAPAGPPGGAVTCVHGDAHLGNALWKDGRLTALLDFEWVRLGPPDLEIEPYLREDVTGLTHIEVREALGWLAESYPAMFAVPEAEGPARGLSAKPDLWEHDGGPRSRHNIRASRR